MQTKLQRAIDYMGLTAGMKITDIEIDTVFIGSCTNSRIEDLRAAAEVARGQKVKDGIRAMIVPGSGLVKEQAEGEGLDAIFRDAGFDWREAGCSMCLAMNADRLSDGERCASTSNRNLKAAKVVVGGLIWSALKWRWQRRSQVALPMSVNFKETSHAKI